MRLFELMYRDGPERPVLVKAEPIGREHYKLDRSVDGEVICQLTLAAGPLAARLNLARFSGVPKFLLAEDDVELAAKMAQVRAEWGV